MKDESMSEQPQFPEAELARVADGSLAPERAAELRRQLEHDPARSDALAAQERAIAMLRAINVPAPQTLRDALEDLPVRTAPQRRRRPRWRLALPTTATVTLAVVLLLVLLAQRGGGPNLHQTVRLTLAAAVTPAPAERSGAAGTLNVSAAGIPFPYWQQTVGWAALGSRMDTVSGRAIVTVFYRGPGARRVGYAIVAGEPLSVPSGSVWVRDGVRYRLLREGSVELVTWLRDGHTCVIAGRGLDPPTLLRLATAGARV